MQKILILGVGNILFTDEGIGVAALNYLQEFYTLPENITLFDGGTLGLRLMEVLLEHEEIFVLDAVLGDSAPGTVYRLTGENLRKSMSFRDSMHQTDLVDTLISCSLMGHEANTRVYGMEPEDFQTLNPALSATCLAALPHMAQKVVEELRSMGVFVEEKNL